MIDPGYQHLLDESRLEDHRCPGSGASFALWAGIRARDDGQPETANPFDAEDESDLHQAWARGHAIQRQALIPLAPVVTLSLARAAPPAPALARITPTHAAKTHACLDRES